MTWNLPSEFTQEFTSSLVWVPGPMFGFEVSEFGLIRRPLDVKNPGRSMRPGFLYPPEVRGQSWIRYRLIDPENNRSIYLKIEDVIVPAFGKLRNKNLFNGNYVARMKSMAIEYNTRFIKPKRQGIDYIEFGVGALRRCTTCGAPTKNYRCEACWIKIRATTTSCDEPNSEYRVAR